MIPRSCAHVEFFPQGEDPMAAGDVLIDQHQQACLLERPRQHELDVGCADVSSGSGLGTFASVDFRQFGVGIGIRPMVGKGGDVTLDLNSIVSQPDEALTTVVRDSTGTTPQTTAFATRSLNTKARLQDGQSLLVGGLVSRNLRDDVSKTPLFGDLPLIGWLFRSKTTNVSKSELFVLVTPSVVRPPIDGSDLWLQPGLGETLAACLS